MAQQLASPSFSTKIKIFFTVLSAVILCSVVAPYAYAQDSATGNVQPAAQTTPTPKKKRRAKKSVQVTDDAAATTPPPTNTSAAESAVSNGNDGTVLKFNTNSESMNTDVRAPMKFKVPGADLGNKPTAEERDTLPEDAPFKTYIGYPKHDLSVFIGAENLSLDWTLGSSDFNYSSTPIEYGVAYKLHLSPLTNLHLEYLTYSATLNAGAIGTQWILDASTASYNSLFVGGDYCFTFGSSFSNQLCPGVDIGRDDYPILQVGSGGTLSLDKVTDITVGVHATWQVPFYAVYLFKLTGGYNMGTGLGNSGTLTSKTNSSYYVQAGVDWNIKGNHTLNLQTDYMARDAELSGQPGGAGSATQDWKTTSSILDGRIGYTYTIQ